MHQAERHWNHRVTASSQGLPVAWDLQNAIRRDMGEWYNNVYQMNGSTVHTLDRNEMLVEGDEYWVNVNPNIDNRGITVYVTYGEHRKDLATVLAMIDQRCCF